MNCRLSTRLDGTSFHIIMFLFHYKIYVVVSLEESTHKECPQHMLSLSNKENMAIFPLNEAFYLGRYTGEAEAECRWIIGSKNQQIHKFCTIIASDISMNAPVD